MLDLDPKKISFLQILHCVKSHRIRNYSGPNFAAFELNTE